MSENELKTAETVALACLKTAEDVSRMMFDAVAAQQARQQGQIRETAEAIALILNKDTD